MTKYVIILVLHLLLLLLPFKSVSKNSIKIAITQSVLERYQEFLDGESCHDFDDFSSSLSSHRAVIELLIICKAFNISAPNLHIEYELAPNNKRAKWFVAKGMAHMTGETVWENDITINNDRFYFSNTIIEKGAMEQGLYVSPDREDMLKISSTKELKNITAVCQPTWSKEWAILDKLELKGVYPASNIEMMYQMVEHSRVDFLLWTFSSDKDLSQIYKNIKLIPIPGIKVKIYDSRKFMLSKSIPNSKSYLSLLNKGLSELSKSNKLNEYFYKSGFFNIPTKNWRVINTEI